MPLILSGKDLAPLFGNAALMETLREAIEESLRVHQRGGIASQGGLLLPMADGRRSFRVITASLSGAGEALRIHPQFPAAKESHLILLFDAESGELLPRW